MTRDEAIEAMLIAQLTEARKQDCAKLGEPFTQDFVTSFEAEYPSEYDAVKTCVSAAYDALLPHIQAERERVREMCATAVAPIATPIEGTPYSAGSRLHINAIRSLDIGGQDDG